jgi:gliding motility-associated-like protein
MLKKTLFILLLSSLCVTKPLAQGTAGKDFWVGFMAHDWSCYSSQWWSTGDTLELFLSSQVAASVNIDAPGQNFSTTVTLTPNETYMVRLPREVVCRYSDTITTNGVHVYSASTINVYAVNRFWYSKGATVVIPSESIVQSPEYFVTTNEEKYSWGWSCNGKNFNSAEFLIVGIADSSVIEIVPTGSSTRYTNKNNPFQIRLKKGETFQYMTTDNDLSGSVIRSKYPLSKYAVFAGNRLTFAGDAMKCWSSWDHAYEQMLPTVAWGQNYTSLPFKNNPGGYYLKILAAENKTQVMINGSYYKTINQGQFFEYDVISDTPVTIRASKRISVAQFTKGYLCAKHPKYYMGDPSQMMLFPDEQFGRSATINTVSATNWWWWNWWWQNQNEHYVNVMTKSAYKDSFTIDNSPISSTLWKNSPNMTGYSFAQIKVDSGSHYLYSKMGFLGYVYGYGPWEGYAFAAAANFKPIQNNFLIENAQCVKDTVRFSAILNDSFADYTWRFGDNSPVVAGKVVKHKYADTGWYSVTMWCKHTRTGHKDSVTKDIYISDTKIRSLLSNDTAYCGRIDIIEISKGFNIDNEYKWNDGHPVYYRAIKNPGIYWLEVMERNGCVFRDSLTVTTSGKPTANFSVSDEVFCLNRNKNVKFTNFSTSDPKDTIKTYTWDFGNKVVTTTHKDSAVYHKFTTSNTFPVVMRATTTKGCIHDTFMVVDVLPSPKANFTFTKKDTCFNTNAIMLKNNTVVNTKQHKRFKWYFTEGFVLSNSNPSTARSYLSTGKNKVMLIYENNNGCIDTMTQGVEVVPNPKAGFTYTNSIFCSLDTIPFRTTSTSPHWPLSFKWNWGDSTVTTGDSVGKKSYKKAGNYTVKLTVTSPPGCRDSAMKSFYVNSTPEVNFVSNRDTQCFVGHKFTFTNKTKFGNGPLNYAWDLGDGTNSTDSNVLNKIFAKDSIYTVKLSTTTSIGCYATVSKKMHVGGYPNTAFTVSPLEQCFRGNLFNFTNKSLISKGNISIQSWDFGDGNSGSSFHYNNKHYNKEDTFKVKLVSISNLGCADTATGKVVTFAQPKSDFLNAAPVQCFNQHSFSFTNKSSLKYGSITYKWHFGDNTSSDSFNPGKQYGASGVYQVSLVSTSDHNCKDTLIRTVTVNASPKAGFAINQAGQCFRNNNFDFTNTSTLSQGSIASYNWSLGDLTSFSGKDMPGKRYLAEDSFTIRMIVVSDQGCADTIKKTAVTFAQPKAGFKVNNLTQCFKQQRFVLENETAIKYGKLSYNWNFGDGKSATDTNYVKKYGKDSTYVISLVSTSDHSCRDTFTRTVVVNISPDALYQVDKDKQCFRGNMFNFVNKSKIGKGSITGFQWDMGDLTSKNSPDVMGYKYVTEDTFKVRLVALSDKNCYDTLIRPAITFAQPQVNFVIPNDSQCWQKNFFVIVNKTKLKYGKLTNSWNFGDNTYSSDFDPEDKKYPNKSASYTMKYKAVSDHGCSDSGEHRVILLERPISEFAINDSIQCYNGHQFSFTNKSTFSVMSTLRYWWDYDNGDTSMGITPKTAKYNGPGLYDIRLISYSYLTNCYDTLFKTVIPAPHANVDYAMNNDSQCLRFNQFVFSNKSKVQFGTMTYKWSYGDGKTDTALNPVKSYTAEGAYIVKLVATTNYNCSDSIEKPIGFYPTPKALFTISDSTQCLNKHSFDFTNTSTVNKGTLSHAWWFDDNTGAASVNFNSKQFSSPYWHETRLSVLSDRGCRDTLTQMIYLEKDRNSRIDFVENDSQCLNGNAFNFSNIKLNSKVSHVGSKWVYGDGQESTLALPGVQNFKSDGNFRVMLVTLSATGCQDTTYADVVVHPHPEVKFTVDKVCFPEPTQFNNLTTIKTGSIKDQTWYFGDGNSSFASDPLHPYAAFGEYNVKLVVRSIHGCIDSLRIDKAAVVQEKPKADFTFDALPTLVLDETRFQFNNFSAKATKYYWDFGNQSNSTESDPIGTYNDTGRFKVTLVAFSSEGCSDTLVKPTGVVLPDFFFFLPNAFSPNEDIHNNIYKGRGTVFVFSFKMEIFNRWGEKMFETTDIHQGWDGIYNGEKCMEGAYLVRVQIVPFKGTLKVYEQMFQLLR